MQGRASGISAFQLRHRHPGLAVTLALAVAWPITGTAAAPEPAAGAVVVGPNGPVQATSPARLRLISQAQYFNTLASIFGPDITVAAHFAPFRRTDGLLATGSASAGVTSGQMQEFQRTAAAIARQVVSPANRSYLIPCTPRNEKTADAACAGKFLGSVGRLLYRRPLQHDELKMLVGVAGEGADRLKDFYAGLAAGLEGELLAPQTLFVMETTEDDPLHPGHRRLDPYSLATRMSLFLWNAAPDDELLERARRGELRTVEGRAKAVDAMLRSPRLEEGVHAFFDDMLGFDDLAIVTKDPMIYPAFAGDAVQDAREQTLRLVFDHLIVRDRDYRDLFTTRETFLSPALATLYGVPAPPVWSAYQMPADSPRVGLLTQEAFLVAHAHPGRSSATRRGKALRELLLCQTVPRPPPNVDFSVIENTKSTLHTARERLAVHRTDPVCAGCHKLTDPIGLALENFDGAGQYRADERGAPIDASGVLDGRSFTDAAGLGQALHDHPALPTCLVKRVYAYGTGGPTAASDKPTLDYLGERFANSGYRFPDLLRAITLSPAFVQVADTPPNPPAAVTARTNTRSAGAPPSASFAEPAQPGVNP